MLVGVNVPVSAADGDDPVAAAVEAERLGFDFVSASDHPSGTDPTHEVWTMLAWIAASTSTIRVATRVLGVPYRSPAVLAKMAETFDRLSGGRLILGLGGGYADGEFRAFGLPVPSPRDKVDGLREAIEVIHGLWSEPAFGYDGRIHRTVAAPMEPKPAHPVPIWLGTYGPRALRVTGELADGWIPSYGFAPPDRVAALRDQVLAAAVDAGRDPAAITCVYNVPVRVDEHAEPRPDAVTGSPGAVAAALLALGDLGFTALNVMPLGGGSQLARFAAEVLPALR